MATRLERIVEQIGQRKQPPVDQWKPKNFGVIDVRIDTQGFWFHEGGPIARAELVNLFASILWHEQGNYFLVTPAEKLSIKVEDVPYIIQQAEIVEDRWMLTTNTAEQVIVGEQNPVELRLFQEMWLPYVKVRYDLWARVNRSIYYQWASDAVNQNVNEAGAFTLFSGEYEFEVARE